MATPSNKPKYFLWGLAIASLILLFIAIFGGVYLQFYSNETKLICKDDAHCLSNEWWTAIWTAGLLIIPCIIQLSIAIYGIIKMNDVNKESFVFNSCLLTFISIITYVVAWFLYNLECNGEYLSRICLFIIFILVIVLIILTFLFLHPESSAFGNYKAGLQQLHFLAIMHFFAIFLSIAFIAGFALAFHDRALDYKAFYMENLEVDKNEGKNKDKDEADKNEDKDTLCKIKYYKENEDGLVEKSLKRCFYYDSEGVNLERLSEDKYNEESIKAADDAKKSKELLLKRLNNKEFENVSECIINMEKKKVPIVYILGRTDLKIPKHLQDNYQLSSIRATNLQLTLTEALSDNQYDSLRDIQWRSSPQSSNTDFTFSPDCPQLGKDELSNKRIVEILVESVTDSASIAKARPDTKNLNVMDYMYFSLYTITTTGYGDIKPVTAYAKFICSLENIIEVFFLVIFVNILISFKESKIINELEKIEEKLKSLAKRSS